MWAQPDVCRLVANNLGSFAVNVGYTPSIVAINLGNFRPMIAGRAPDVCKPLQVVAKGWIGSVIVSLRGEQGALFYYRMFVLFF